MPLYEIHPIIVHFPIALLLAGALFKALELILIDPSPLVGEGGGGGAAIDGTTPPILTFPRKGGRDFWDKRLFAQTSLWLLRLGFLGAVAAAGFGLLAEKTAPHVPAAWETLWDHKRLGLATAGVSIALWIVEELARRTPKPWLTWLGRLLWLAAVVLVIAAGNEGGELVYTYGVGVAAAPHL